MLASEIKTVRVHHCPLPLDSRVEFSVIVTPPLEKCIAPGAFIQINMVNSSLIWAQKIFHQCLTICNLLICIITIGKVFLWHFARFCCILIHAETTEILHIKD